MKKEAPRNPDRIEVAVYGTYSCPAGHNITELVSPSAMLTRVPTPKEAEDALRGLMAYQVYCEKHQHYAPLTSASAVKID